MGGSLSRLLADLIIENKIEKKILQHPRWKKCWDWVRLIDDTLSGWELEEVFDDFFFVSRELSYLSFFVFFNRRGREEHDKESGTRRNEKKKTK